jgi:hypothetical protein
VYPDRRDFNLLCNVDSDCGGAWAELFITNNGFEYSLTLIGVIFVAYIDP